MNRYISIIAAGTLIVLFVSTGFAQSTWAVGISGGYSQPVGTLRDRFGGTVNVQGEVIYQYSEKIDIETAVGYFKYEETSYSFSSSRRDRSVQTENLILDFENVVVSLAGRYHLSRATGVRPYLLGGTAIHRWVARRGPFSVDFLDEDGTVTSSMAANRYGQSDYSLGFLVGGGFLFSQSQALQFKIEGRYQFILAEIYASRAAGLDKVNPIQSLWVNAGIQFGF